MNDLIQQARQGNRTAMNELIERYQNYLLAIANKEVQGEYQARFGASDVVQQSLIHAEQNFDQFLGNEEGELLAWLRKILQNDLRKAHRAQGAAKRNVKQEIRSEQGAEKNTEHAGVVADRSLTPSAKAIKKEKAQLLSEALRQLPEEYHLVIQLRNFEFQEFKEIGLKLNRSPDAARKLWARAIRALEGQIAHLTDELLTGNYKNESKGAR